jgi:hypothetical protein
MGMVKKPLPKRLAQNGVRQGSTEAKPAVSAPKGAPLQGKLKAPPQTERAKSRTLAQAEIKSVAKIKPAPTTLARKGTSPGKGESASAPRNKPKSVTRHYVLEVKELAPSEVGAVLAKLKFLGVGHVVEKATQKVEPMHRLFLADFGKRDEALEELSRLKLVSSDAFMLNENSRYAVYAGSYLRQTKAVLEQDRLLAKGVKLLIRSAAAPVVVVRVRAGRFADQAGAERGAKALQRKGVLARVVMLAS